MKAVKDKLNAHQLKATPTRLAVLELMTKHTGAIPFAALQGELEGTDRITLFRTLNTFVESGVVHKAHFQNGDTYYAMCSSTCSAEGHFHDHVHFKCTTCEIVSCKKLPAGVRIDMPDVDIHKIDINVMGVCADCR